jgi:hypothetical protein
VPRNRSRGGAAIPADSFAWSMLAPAALAMGGLDVPEDVPGTDEGVAGAVMPGCPSPGVRFVEQPNAANETIAAAAANPRNPPCKCCVFLVIKASKDIACRSLFRATGEPEMTRNRLAPHLLFGRHAHPGHRR